MPNLTDQDKVMITPQDAAGRRSNFCRSASRGLGIGLAVAAAFLVAACDGSQTEDPAGIETSGGAQLVNVEYGRLVDVYAWHRNDIAVADRLDPTTRAPVLIQEDVVVRGDLVSELLSASNQEANYRFLPFDPAVGHDELLILWDSRESTGEDVRFEAAVEAAQLGLEPVRGAFIGQDPSLTPFPVVPRSAAFVLTFDAVLTATSSLLQQIPEAVQLLAVSGDPEVEGPQVLTPLPVRVVVERNRVIVDPSILGGEVDEVGLVSPGLPPAPSNGANLRLALPTVGPAADVLNTRVDDVSTLNSVGFQGEAAVIRDFRSANLSESLSSFVDGEAPALVGSFEVGIIGVDPTARLLTINKRANLVAVRGRIPFVDGVRPTAGASPGGPETVPTTVPLASGDMISQRVLSDGGRPVTVSAEILEVLAVVSVADGASAPGLTEQGTDGAELEQITVRVGSVRTELENGDSASFGAATTPLGADATLRTRYYENVPLLAGGAVSDAGRRTSFLAAAPEPLAPGPVLSAVDPFSTFTLSFSEPLDSNSVGSLDNLVLTSDLVGGSRIQEALDDPKLFGVGVVASRLVDLSGEGVAFQLAPPMGLHHRLGVADRYWLHAIGGVEGDSEGAIRDLAGNALDLWDRRETDPVRTWSVEIRLDAAAPSNAVGWSVHRFAGEDEDGTAPNAAAPDWFGQGELVGGRLFGAAPVRRRVTAAGAQLGQVSRFDRGECFAQETDAMNNPIFGTGRERAVTRFVPAGAPSSPTGFLYETPSALSSVALPGGMGYSFGGITEPHTRFGARQMMTYRSDDFGLDDRDPDDFNIDVEQLYWSSWRNQDALFDVFQRYTMRLGHSERRPDYRFEAFDGVPPIGCLLLCASMNSGLSAQFGENPLDGSELVDVATDARYEVNPSEAIREDGIAFVSYPAFDRSYTWRDSRLVSWDPIARAATGLGGAQDTVSESDFTTNVTSPWTRDNTVVSLKPPIPAAVAELYAGRFNFDFGDFRGDVDQDLDPIALPLLVDLLVFPENGSTPTTSNQFQIAHTGLAAVGAGPIFSGLGDVGGFYAAGTSACGGQPWLRVHETGGQDPLSGLPRIIEPASVTTATGGLVVEPGIGNPFQTQPGDGHLNWAAADLVRKVSLQTFGFVDSFLPNRNEIPTVPGLGFPDLRPLATSGIRDITLILDGADVPGDTEIAVEYRFGSGIENIDQLWNPEADDTLTRGNLRNPHYACEAFRYATDRPGFSQISALRVPVDLLTRYVTTEDLDDIRDGNGLLPRFFNLRMTMVNDVDGIQPLRPSLGGLATVFRLE